MNLTVERVTAGYHGKTVIFDVDLEARRRRNALPARPQWIW